MTNRNSVGAGGWIVLTAAVVIGVALLLLNRAGDDKGKELLFTGGQGGEGSSPDVMVDSGGAVHPSGFGAETVSVGSIAASAKQDHEGAAAMAPGALDSPSIPDDPKAALAFFENTSLPLDLRLAEVLKLGKRGDTKSLEVLMALGGEKTYLNWVAVELLGGYATSPAKPDVAKYLKEKMDSGDSQMACAAIRAFTTLMGTDSVSELSTMLVRNHVRADGYHELVCSTIVQMLLQTGSLEAIPAFISEMSRSEDKAWSMEYGSQLVQALGRMNTLEGRTAIADYANRLEARKPAESLARKYYEDKIAEARRVAVEN